MDLKIRQYAEATMQVPPKLARILQEKKEDDRRRLTEVREELLRFLETQ